jgi:uncharacterized protein (DUF2132 family)
MPPPIHHPRDPLHGITLERIVKELVAQHGWAEMGHRIPIRCFQFNPSVKSSLTFLRKTPWARSKVEAWFIEAGLNKQSEDRSVIASHSSQSETSKRS